MKNDLAKSIAYCGLICGLCFQGGGCQGCKSTNSRCDVDLSDEGCYQKNCCLKKGFDGCWQCAELSACERGIYSLGNFSKIKAFAICIGEDGKDAFIANIARNEKRGLSVEKGKDYDGKSIQAVLKMIRTPDYPIL
jgi:hypothetical protein